MTYLELAQKVLEKADFPLGYNQIWQKAVEMGLDKKLKSVGKTPWQSVGAQIYVNIRDKANSNFVAVSKNPQKFWLKARQKELPSDEKIQEIQVKEVEKKEKEFDEKALHPLLVSFANREFNLYCKTLNANTTRGAKTQGLDEWIHPDIVGVYFPFDDKDNYKKETLALLENLNKLSYKIYSFELKKFINSSNLKQSYFQAVSNSSWANEGYLVAYEISSDEKVYNELTRLNSSFGIGVIELKNQRVIFPSKVRELDIDTINLLMKNKDFEGFIENVNKDIQTNDSDRIAKTKYDRVDFDYSLE